MTKLKDRPWIVYPLALLLLLAISFGLATPFLRLYWDDWPIVAAARLQGVQAFWEYYRYERPLSAWSYTLTIPLLGTHPLVWHLFSLLLRWLAVAGFWICLQWIWPDRRQEAAWAAFLFAIYPVFTQQPVAITFNQQWQIYTLYFLSVGAMLLSVRKPRWFWPLNLLGLAAALLHMVTMEYLWSLELLRPLLLWLALQAPYAQRTPRLARWRKLLAHWAPYLLLLAAMLVWWFNFQRSLPESHSSELIFLQEGSVVELQTGALALQLVQAALQDLVHNLVGAWYQTITPGSLVLTDRPAVLSLVLGLFTALLAALFFRWSVRRQELAVDMLSGPAEDRPAWWQQAALLGLVWTLLGPLPVWLIDRQSLLGLQSGRFALAALPGMSLLIVGLLEGFTPRRMAKILLLAFMVGASTGYHQRVAVTYYRSSLSQTNFFWQLYWRAPGLQPGTALLSADELFLYMGRKPTAIALNLLYPQPYGITQAGYWFLELYHDVGPLQVPRLVRGKVFDESFRTFQFSGSSLDSLVIYYKPGAGRCLWVLSPDDVELAELPDITRQAVNVANLDRILPQPGGGSGPPVELFGAEPEHTWCYYYQKAQLARHQGRWQEVLDLGVEASQNNFAPDNPYEHLPFIEAQARRGSWLLAVRQTETAWQASPDLAPRLCLAWQKFLDGAAPAGEEAEAVSGLLQQMSCSFSP